nr:integrase, catalytic region, zinc finger, CCHC-type, peptidase aspartic, catalytic [Tanacetum cinerariifolium]
MGTLRETLTEGALHLGETIHYYYVWFAKLINDMLNIKMTMSRMQLNSKFVNNMLPEWGRFVTAVKLNRGLRDSNYDQLYAYLKQHENVQGRQNRGQGNNALGAGAAGYEGAQNRVGYSNPGQARQIKCYNCNDSADDEDVDEQPIQDLALNVDNVFQIDNCDAFDSDVDEAPTAQTLFMANLSSVDPVYDEASLSYDSNILSEVYDHDHYQDTVCEHHEVYEMHDDVQPNYVVDSHSDYTSDSNMTPYDQNKLNRWARFELTEREQKIDEQLRIVITDRNIKEENLKKELHSVKMQLASTINHNKSMVEEVKSLKKDFKQKENKYLKEFLDMKALKEKVEDKLFKQDQSLQTVHMLCKPKPYYDEQRKAAIGYKSLLCLARAKQVQLALYNDSVTPKVLAPDMYAIDVKLIPSRLRNNREVHLGYLKHLKESKATLREIVEEAKVERPLDRSVASACLYTKHSHELLEYVVQIVLWYLDSGCSKHMISDRLRQKNFVKKFIETIRFGNDHFGAIMGYRYYVIGDSVISRVYCMERLGHNLFSVGQFCDSDLEVAFRKHSYYVRDSDGVELIKGSHGFNLYTISVEDMMKSFPICLLSKAFKTFKPLELRVFHQKLVSKTPKQNGIVERRNRTLVEATRIMLIFSKALVFLWVAVVATACYTQNRSLIHTYHNKTSYELVYNKKPDLTFLCIFGTLCYPTNDSEDLGKLQPMADIGIFYRTRSYISYACTYKFRARTKSGSCSNLCTSTNKELEILFQPMFNEYMEPPRVDRPVSPAPAVPVPVNSAGTTSSTSIDQDCNTPKLGHSGILGPMRVTLWINNTRYILNDKKPFKTDTLDLIKVFDTKPKL